MYENAIESTKKIINRLNAMRNATYVKKKENFPIGCKIRITGAPRTIQVDFHDYNWQENNITVIPQIVTLPDRRGMIGVVKKYWYEMLSIQFVGNDQYEYQYSPDDCMKL